MEIDLIEAAFRIKKGEVVAVPTETVYGLAAFLKNSEAVDKIFALKGRPSDNPLIIHLDSESAMYPFIKDSESNFCQLTKNFWPGSLTLVLPILEEKIPQKVRANLKTAAFRVPSHPVTRELIKLTGPLVMPSANLSGRPSSTLREHVEADFGIDFPVLEGLCPSLGLESTILYFDEKQKVWQIIREGALSQEAFLEVLGYKPEIIKVKGENKPLCPGQLYRHYSPKAKLQLVKSIDEGYEGVIVGFDDYRYPKGAKVYSLGALKNPEMIGKNLYKVLRQLDKELVQGALVDSRFEEVGLLKTVLERLKKACGSNI